MQQNTSRARGLPDDGTCRMPKHFGDLLTFVEHTVCLGSLVCKLHVNGYNIPRENDRLDSTRRTDPLFRYLTQHTFSIYCHLQPPVQRVATKHVDRLLKGTRRPWTSVLMSLFICRPCLFSCLGAKPGDEVTAILNNA